MLKKELSKIYIFVISISLIIGFNILNEQIVFAGSTPELIVEYDFDNNLNDELGNSNATEYNTSTSSFGTNSGAGNDQTYWEWTANGNPGGGFYIDVDQDVSESYSVGVRFSYDEIDSSYNKIIDYKNQTADTGFYFISSGYLTFYPHTASKVTQTNANDIVDIIATRDGTTETFTAYIIKNGVLVKEIEVDDSGGQAIPSLVGGKPRLGFFFDDTVTNGEYSTGGKVYSVKIWDGPITQEEAEEAMNSLPDLSNLSISEGSLNPGFSAETTEYSVTVDNATTDIALTPTAADGASTIKVENIAVNSGDASNNISLDIGNNEIEIVVTAEDGITTKTYSININRESVPANGTYMTTDDNENNNGDGVADNDMDLDIGSSGDADNIDIHPIEFNINLTGELPNSSAILAIRADDVDEEMGEIDEVYLNGTKIGVLTGTDGEWSVSLIEVPTNLILAGVNLVEIYVDDASDDPYDNEWETEVDYGQLIIDGGVGDEATISNINASYDTGNETIDVDFDYTGINDTETLTIEYVLTRTMASGEEMLGSFTETYTNISDNDTQNFSHSFDINLAGEYTTHVMLRNSGDMIQEVKKQAGITVDPLSSTGEGTENDPYILTTRGHLEDVSFYVLNTDVYLELGSDINLSSGDWSPIGDDELFFKGNFDGKDYAISQMTIDKSDDDYIGLFGGTYDATISNVILNQLVLDGDDETGGLIGIAYRTDVENIKVSNADIEGQDDGIGGIIGEAYDSTITDCTFDGQVKGDEEVGGIVGFSENSQLTKLFSSGTVSGYQDVGGIIGQMDNGSITEATCDGFIVAEYDAGGIVGYNRNGDISKSAFYNMNPNGIIINGYYAGGIVGYSKNGNISQCFSVVSIKSDSGDEENGVGGIAGFSGSNITDCYSINKIELNNTEYYESVGGIAGYQFNDTLISNTIADTTITIGTESGAGAPYRWVGGIVGYNDARNIENSFYVTYGLEGDEIQSEGINQEFASLKSHSDFTTFDFDNIWSDMHNGMTFPNLKWTNVDDVLVVLPPVIDSATAEKIADVNYLHVYFDEEVIISQADCFVVELDNQVVVVNSAIEETINGKQVITLEIDHDLSTITTEKLTINYVQGGQEVTDMAGNELSGKLIRKTDIVDYEVVINPSETRLADLSLSTGVFAPSFDTDVYSYSSSVETSVDSIKVLPTIMDSSSTIKVNGVSVNSGSLSQDISLSYGVNSIPVIVTGVDGLSTTYTLSITRIVPKKKNNNDDDNSNSSTTKEPEKDSAIVIINGEEETAGEITQITEEGKIIVIVEVNKELIESKLEEAIAENDGKEENVIKIPVSSNTSDSIKVELTGDIVKKLETNIFNIAIERDNIEYIIPAEELTISKIASSLNINEENLKDIKIEVEISKLDEAVVNKYNEVATANGSELVFPPVKFNIIAKTVRTDGKTDKVEINKFSNYVERVMEIPSEVDPSKITTGIVFNTDGTYSHVPTEVFKKDGKWYAKLNSLTNSNYSVIWNPIKVMSVEEHWSKEAVNDLAARLVIFNTDNFDPNKAISRADFAEYIVRALGLYREGTSLENKFSDVNDLGERTLAILIANEYGIISGYPDETFRPNMKITREEAMVMYARAMGITKLTGQEKLRFENYTDYNNVSLWANNHVKETLSAHVFNGTTLTKISPKAELTYGEAAQAIRNLLIKSNLINK